MGKVYYCLHNATATTTATAVVDTSVLYEVNTSATVTPTSTRRSTRSNRGQTTRYDV